ncbi:MAG: phosphoribosyl-AMP cyclohydrolase [Rhizobiaceae bacterium]
MSAEVKSNPNTETGTQFLPRFDKAGLVTALVCEMGTNSPLMVAHMNKEALQLTIETGEAHFYSRSRAEIWHKGGTSGNTLSVVEMRVDCDQDAIWLSVSPNGHGAACHTGRKSCFYRRIVKQDGSVSLEMDDDSPLFDPDLVYNR